MLLNFRQEPGQLGRRRLVAERAEQETKAEVIIVFKSYKLMFIKEFTKKVTCRFLGLLTIGHFRTGLVKTGLTRIGPELCFCKRPQHHTIVDRFHSVL